MIELSEIMCQKGDTEFIELLGRVRVILSSLSLE